MAGKDDIQNPSTPSTVLSKTTRLKTRVRYPKIRVEIDAKLIVEWIRCDVEGCLISKTIMENYPNLINVTTDQRTIRATDRETNLRFTWLTPAMTVWFINDIDQGLHPRPFPLRLGKPIAITRSGGHQRLKTPEQRRNADAFRKREYRKVKRLMMAQEMDAPSQEQKEYAAQVVSAMKKRDKPLGPAVGMRGANASNGSEPIIVGGAPYPRKRHPNVLRTRRFGARMLKE